MSGTAAQSNPSVMIGACKLTEPIFGILVKHCHGRPPCATTGRSCDECTGRHLWHSESSMNRMIWQTEWFSKFGVVGRRASTSCLLLPKETRLGCFDGVTGNVSPSRRWVPPSLAAAGCRETWLGRSLRSLESPLLWGGMRVSGLTVTPSH